MSWGSKQIQGVRYDLSHLDTFTMDVPSPTGGRPHRVRVSFGCHCFTRETTPADTPDLLIRTPDETRSFCPNRFADSVDIADVIRAAVGNNVHFSQTRNFVLVKRAAGQPPYAIFFNIERGQSKGVDVAIFVVSAYPKSALPAKLPTIGFNVLVEKVARGLRINRPQK
jgi:hypothetical protein